MNYKIVIAILIIVVGIVFCAITFFEKRVEYGNFQSARISGKKIQVKGEWIREKETRFDPSENKFSFYLRDENNEEVQVIHEGTKPNNFELAPNIVVKGQMKDGKFYSSEILTKCPSKYEGSVDTIKHSEIF